MQRLLALLVAAFVLLGATGASADDTPPAPFLRMRSEHKLCWPDLTNCVVLPPGYYVQEYLYNDLDAEMKRLQDQETRLGAENQSLRSSANDVPWLPIALGVAAGLLLGTYIGTKL
jgi:hypothetical protein